MNTNEYSSEIKVRAEGIELEGSLSVPDSAQGIVVFAHGSGSSRFSPRNRAVAQFLNEGGLATLLFDLLTAEENDIDMQTRRLRFDIGLLSRRLIGAVDWLGKQASVCDLQIGLFGASTGAAAALIAAARRPEAVAAVVSRGGRADLAGEDLPLVEAPTLLIVGGLDQAVIGMNRWAASQMRIEPRLEIVAGASHLFEEPGTMEQVARLTRDWFVQHLVPMKGR